MSSFRSKTDSRVNILSARNDQNPYQTNQNSALRNSQIQLQQQNTKRSSSRLLFNVQVQKHQHSQSVNMQDQAEDFIKHLKELCQQVSNIQLLFQRLTFKWRTLKLGKEHIDLLKMIHECQRISPTQWKYKHKQKIPGNNLIKNNKLLRAQIEDMSQATLKQIDKISKTNNPNKLKNHYDEGYDQDPDWQNDESQEQLRIKEVDKQLQQAYQEVGALREKITLERSRFERFQDGNKIETLKNHMRDINKDKKLLNEKYAEIQQHMKKMKVQHSKSVGNIISSEQVEKEEILKKEIRELKKRFRVLDKDTRAEEQTQLNEFTNMYEKSKQVQRLKDQIQLIQGGHSPTIVKNSRSVGQEKGLSRQSTMKTNPNPKFSQVNLKRQVDFYHRLQQNEQKIGQKNLNQKKQLATIYEKRISDTTAQIEECAKENEDLQIELKKIMDMIDPELLQQKTSKRNQQHIHTPSKSYQKNLNHLNGLNKYLTSSNTKKKNQQASNISSEYYNPNYETQKNLKLDFSLPQYKRHMNLINSKSREKIQKDPKQGTRFPKLDSNSSSSNKQSTRIRMSMQDRNWDETSKSPHPDVYGTFSNKSKGKSPNEMIRGSYKYDKSKKSFFVTNEGGSPI